MHTVGLVRATSLAPFLRYVKEQGGRVEPHLDEGRVPGELTEQPDAWISKLQVYRVLESVVSRESGEGLGLETGRNIKLDDLGSLGEAVAQAASLRDACLIFGRLLPQLAQGNTVDLHVQRRKAWFTYSTVDHTVGNRDAADHYGLMILLAIVREVAGPGWLPDDVRLQTGATRAFSSDEAWAATRVHFNQSGTGFSFPATWLSRPFRQENLSESVLPEIVPVTDTLTVSIRALVASYLPIGGAPTLEMMADALGMSQRTLKRRLAMEGASFSHLLDRVRFEYARGLLRDPGVTVREVAHRLGYSGPNNLVRAFHRIAGCTPGEWRQRAANE